MIGLIFFTINITLEKLNLVNQMTSLSQLSDIGVKSSSLVHELQKERGLSAGFLGSKGVQFSAEIKKQRAKTDDTINELKMFLKKLQSKRFAQDIQDNMKTIFDKLKLIEAKRQLIDGLKISVENELFYYTGIIKLLLANINQLSTRIIHVELSNQFLAYINIVQVKERAGIERATLNNALSQDYFAQGAYEKFISLVEAQNIFIGNFFFVATFTQKTRYRETMQGEFIIGVDKIRKKVLAHYSNKRSNDSFNVTPIHWWQMATGRIALFKVMEDHISSELKSAVLKLKQSAFFMFIFHLTITGGMILFTLFYGYSTLKVIEQAYARFVPNEFLRLLNKKRILDIQLGNQKEMEMTVLFSDIRSFTSLSEQMSPQENFDFLNTYLGEMGPIIEKHQGFIDKYIGDAIMALFVNTDDAVNAAIAMVKIQQNQSVITGIGINTGKLMLGIIGETKRLQCTVISDAVNVASRVENLTKTYKSPLIITQSTLDNLKNPAKYAIRFLDNLKIKGRLEPTNIFEVFDAEAKEVRNKKWGIIKDFERGIHLYQKGCIADAKKLMALCLQQSPDDSAADIYIQRCQNFLKIRRSEAWEEIARQVKCEAELSIINPTIDEQHKNLLVRIRNLVMSIGIGKTEKEVNDMIHFLDHYVVNVFGMEEKLMKKHNYPDYAVHKAQHLQFVNNLERIKQDYERHRRQFYLTMEIQNSTFDWVIRHIKQSDKKLGIFLKG
jgi:hemerythrin